MALDSIKESIIFGVWDRQHPLLKIVDLSIQIFYNFTPIDEYLVEHDLPILGRIPPCLCVCNGANPLFELSAGHHLFDGELEERPL
ncbi:9-cis-epoxycarotenoid dioxygenase [Asimina triloba]